MHSYFVLQKYMEKVNKLFRKSWIWVIWSSTSRSSARRQVLTDGSSLPRMDCHGHASILFFALYDGMVPFTRILYFRIFGFLPVREYCTSCISQYKKSRLFWMLVILGAFIGAIYFNLTFIIDFLNTTTLISIKVNMTTNFQTIPWPASQNIF